VKKKNRRTIEINSVCIKVSNVWFPFFFSCISSLGAVQIIALLHCPKAPAHVKKCIENKRLENTLKVFCEEPCIFSEQKEDIFWLELKDRDLRDVFSV